MQHVFWAIPQRLAGRPGPNRAPWDPAELFAGGFRSVLTVNRGIEVDPDALRRAGLEHRHLPFPVGIPPEPTALDDLLVGLPEAFAWYLERSRAGAVLVHCTFGRDRTGMFLGYALMREQGLDPDRAIEQLRRVRSIALSAEGWEDLARRAFARLLGAR